MIEIKGTCNTALCYTSELDEKAAQRDIDFAKPNAPFPRKPEKSC